MNTSKRWGGVKGGVTQVVWEAKICTLCMWYAIAPQFLHVWMYSKASTLSLFTHDEKSFRDFF